MGKFFTALHIKSKCKDQFIKTFTQLMKKDGYVPCSEDEAAISYAAAFSEDGWVTLSNGDDSTNELSKTAKKITEGMDTLCFTAEVVDSDFAILNLFTQNGSESRVIVGNGSGYGIEKAPFLADMWKPLIQSGDESEFVRTLGLENTFVEDTLYDIGKIFGITPSVMTWCYDEFEEEIGHDGNVIFLSFRKTAEKKISLNAAFKQVFGEALEPLGFKLIKSKYPYFVRVVPSGEIIHVITVKKETSYLHAIRREGFTILSGTATVYRPKIDLSVSPRDNTRWLLDIRRIYINTNRFNCDPDLLNSLSELSYAEDNRESQLEAMKLSLEYTKNIVIPALNKAVDIDSFARICFIEHDGLNPEWHFDAVKGGELNPNDVDDEGLVLVKVKDYPSFVDWSMEYRKIINSRRVGYKFDKYSEEDYTEFCSKIGEYKQQYISKMSDIKNDTQFYDMIELELEKRRCLNIETLRSYGLEI